MILNVDLWQIFGLAVFGVGLLDSWKYRLLVYKVKRYKSSKTISRMFVNYAILHKVLLAVWGAFYLKDWVVTLSCLVALYTSLELFYWTYVFYPYKYRNLKNFKRPSIWVYFINSWLKNTKANRL